MLLAHSHTSEPRRVLSPQSTPKSVHPMNPAANCEARSKASPGGVALGKNSHASCMPCPGGLSMTGWRALPTRQVLLPHAEEVLTFYGWSRAVAHTFSCLRIQASAIAADHSRRRARYRLYSKARGKASSKQDGTRKENQDGTQEWVSRLVRARHRRMLRRLWQAHIEASLPFENGRTAFRYYGCNAAYHHRALRCGGIARGSHHGDGRSPRQKCSRRRLLKYEELTIFKYRSSRFHLARDPRGCHHAIKRGSKRIPFLATRLRAPQPRHPPPSNPPPL